MHEEPLVDKIIIGTGLVLIIVAFGGQFAGQGGWSPTVSALTGIGLLLGIVCSHLWRIILQLSEINAAVRARRGAGDDG